VSATDRIAMKNVSTNMPELFDQPFPIAIFLQLKKLPIEHEEPVDTSVKRFSTSLKTLKTLNICRLSA
jgi:hypothetical protein